MGHQRPSPASATSTPTVTLHWAPESYISPCFKHFGADDPTKRCLTRTQVALHEQQQKYNALNRQAEADKEEWQRMKQHMEAQLNDLKIRNAEAERLFKREEQRLDKKLADTQQALGSLNDDHINLRNATAEQLAALQAKLATLQNNCHDLQGERDALQRQVEAARLTADALRDARQRVAELEAGIAATQQRAQQMIRAIQKQRDAAANANEALQHQLSDTQRALSDQQSRSDAAVHQAKVMLLQQRQLSHELEIERRINEPLRYTNHATTTFTHCMRAVPSPYIQDRLYLPLQTTPTRVAPSQEQSFTPYSTSSTSRREAATTTCSADVDPQAQEHAEATLNPWLQARSQSPGMMAEEQVAAGTELICEVGDTPGLQESAVPGIQVAPVLTAGSLARLGRAWATTSPTASPPHPAYCDNIARFAGVYASPQPGSLRPHSAGARCAVLSPPALTRQLRPASAAGAVGRSKRHTRPTAVMMRTYHQTRAGPAPRAAAKNVYGANAYEKSSIGDGESTISYK